MWTIRTFFRFLKGRCYGNRFMAKFGYMRSFGIAAFENGLQYRHSNSKIFSGNILATFYISPTVGPIFTNVSALVDVCMGITKLSWVSRQSKGRCYGNLLILGLFADVKIDRLRSLLFSSETECIVALHVCINSTLIHLRHVKRWWKSDQ